MPLPIPGASKNNWGTQLNEFLRTAHNEDGSLKDVATETDFIALSAAVDQIGSQVDVSLNPDGTLVPSEVEDAYVAAGGLTGLEATAVQAATEPLVNPGTDGQVLTVVSGDPAWRDQLEIDIRDCGAVGDGVTDDSAAFALALAKVSARGGTILIHPGHYIVPNGITENIEGLRVVGLGNRLLAPGEVDDWGW